MSVIILLDSGPLGLLTNPKSSAETRECNLWLARLLQRGIEVKIPEITDYEVRRELLRADKHQDLKRLDDLQNVIDTTYHSQHKPCSKLPNFGHKYGNRECKQQIIRL